MTALTLAARIALWTHTQAPDVIHDRLVTEIITELAALGPMTEEIEQEVTFPQAVLWAMIDADADDEWSASTENTHRTFQLIAYSPVTQWRADSPTDEPPRLIYKRTKRQTEPPQ